MTSPAGTSTLRSVRTTPYKRLLAQLPPDIQEKAEKLFARFQKDQFDPILCNEDLYDSNVGRHRKGSRSVRITLRYRAIYVVDNGPKGDQPEQVCWYWIGSRESYANFIGSR